MDVACAGDLMEQDFEPLIFKRSYAGFCKLLPSKFPAI